MNLKFRRWVRCSPMQKATYLAQIATVFGGIVGVFALPLTVYFTYKTWDEARSARADQSNAFYAEKAPKIEISDPNWMDGHLFFYLRNSGVSTAINVGVKCTVIKGGKTGRILPEKPDLHAIVGNSSIKTACMELNTDTVGFNPIKLTTGLSWADDQHSYIDVYCYYEDAVSHKLQTAYLQILLEK